ncbi:hepatocellular carcinoma-associated antigen 66 [Bimuria novae-zelandiae CBS 107.79]|uniref:Hepatocellular carcinoma-associated antigen 66 n=1 Tax=Bimuria novae-zelandiae CBS 107.79 TaxID=1447943 RepID=A0A6A5V0D2_9PLEO|nr:hepatocellular carcinoma-associated antigen 66 [Bimuria novae-zelandiae CBS 107.79]
MAGPSDKARFFLEQSAEELNALERKQIFSRDEISSIARKRSDFEHIVNARGSHPSDWLRYIEFEKNVDALRRKRIKRMHVRYRGSGQRTIYSLYGRGTRKFPGDLGLWMQYIEFARKDKAFKRLNEIFTQVVRLHPTKSDLWIYAANYFMDSQADITDARSYMQRGLRFCKNSEQLWIEYAKLETIYIGKIAGRRKILGLDVDRTRKEQNQDDEDENMIALPEVTAEDVNPSLKQDDGVDEVALQNLASAPILTGAIPIAIFDSAMKQFSSKAVLAERFFDMFAEFDQVPSVKRILQHVLDFLGHDAADAVQTAACTFRLSFFGLHPASPEFPTVLRDALDTLNAAIAQHPTYKPHLSNTALRQILLSVRSAEETDPVVRKVLSSQLRKFTGFLEEMGDNTGDSVATLAETLKREGKREDAKNLIQSSLKRFGTNERLQQLHAALVT